MVRPANNAEIKGFRVGILNAYMSEKEVVEKDRAYTFSRHILPMPMPVSPVYALLRGIPTRTVVNSIDQFMILRHIYMCFCANPHMPCHKKQVVETHDQFVNDCEGRFYKDMETLVSAFKNQELNERQAIESLIPILATFTLDQINFMEIAIMETLVFKAPVTEGSNLDLSSLNDVERVQFFQAMRLFFDAKGKIMNEMLARSRPDSDKSPYVPRDFFGVGQFDARLRDTPPAEVYRGFIDRTTAMEYLKYLDFDESL